MLQTEYIRSMQCNYERILLEKQPEEKRYQYCILNRGGIKGLLSCSLRYLDGVAYLYYDISSKQSVTQLYGRRCISRQWLLDFVWSIKQLGAELGRFLLDERNVLWLPEQIFQDVESNTFSFMYVPYYEGENSFLKMLDFLVEHIDYEDEGLVECVYRMYEQCERDGEMYLQARIFMDVKVLEEVEVDACEEKPMSTVVQADNDEVEQPIASKKGIRYLFDGKKRRYKNAQADYRKSLQLTMEGYAVAEETPYHAVEEVDEEYGKTVYIEESKSYQEIVRRLYASDGRIIRQIGEGAFVIGKKKEEADLVLEDFSVSRMHARISKEADGIYIEDLNSTNGTYKNGLRLQPYEKKKLEEGDEIKIGKIVLLYR